VRLLIIDEADTVRVRLAEILREIVGLEVFNFSAHAANLGKQVRACAADVVVMDIHMPGSALDLIRSLKSGPHSPTVIALSSASTPQYRSSCLHAGAEYFFDALNEQEKLVETISDLQKKVAY
jgi:two-component system response regulator DevR